jgi:hypothetical protein
MEQISFLKPLSINGKIRLGRKQDGGYVIYEPALRKTEILITYGVGWEISFEEDFNRETGKEVLMFDPTMFDKYIVDLVRLRKQIVNLRLINVIEHLKVAFQLWMKNIELKKKSIHFINEGIALQPSNKYNSFRGHLERYQLRDKSILLKIDIEGGEFDLFNDFNIYSDLTNVNQLVIEFHNLKNRLRELKIIVEKIKGAGFEIVHIHGNNAGVSFVLYSQADQADDVIFPDLIELTFVKKKLIRQEDIVDGDITYPILDLDFPNLSKKEELTLNF